MNRKESNVYVVYETTNAINGKKYIGKATESRIKHGYKGSGIRLHKAFDKYGRENFSTKILYRFATEEEAFAKERELVNRDIVLNPNYYNIQEGGSGGTKGSIIITNGKEIYRVLPETAEEFYKQGFYHYRKEHSAETRAKMSISHKGKPGTMKGKHHSEETRRKISEAGKGRKHTPEWIARVSAKNRGKKRSDEVKAKISASNKGKTFSEESRHKMSESHKGLPVWNKGTKLDYKTVWMNNGQKNARIREENIEQKLSEGWVKGKFKSL